MVSSRRDAVNKILRCSGVKDKNAVQEALENMQTISANEGLSDDEFEELVTLLTSKKISSYIAVKLFHCLVPKALVSNKALKDLLSWYFSEIGRGRISKAIEKEFIHWVTGIVNFELANVSIIDSYFHSFLFLLHHGHLESVVSKLVCLLLKPEDAKRWTVTKILEMQKKNGPKCHTNSILSILKSFRPDVVPENVPMIRLNYDHSTYRDCFRSAHERRINSTEYVPSSAIEIRWNQHKCYDKKSVHLPRLIPIPESIDFEPSVVYKDKKFSVVETRNMSSLGAHCLRIEIPSQTFSLLTNHAGFHVLAFSDSTTKMRFSYKLRYTLFRVFVLELEPYSRAEKSLFLDSIVGLEEYMQEGMPAVTEFLLHYLSIWDGEDFRNQILSLVQWVVLKSAPEWQECLFRPLRQVFRSSGIQCKCLIVEAMSSLLRNLIASVGRKESTFFDDSTVGNVAGTAEAIENLAAFVGELTAEGIIWNNEDGRRNIVSDALDFYEICSMVEYSPDFPIIVVMPPMLVYGCLFSGSRLCIAKMCSLLLRFWRNIFENLLRLGNGNELEIKIFYIYILDHYRYLWSSADFLQEEDSFIFNSNAFREMSGHFERSFGVSIKRIFNVENNVTFISGGYSPNVSKQLVENVSSEYTSIVELKLLCESEIFRNLQLC